MAFLAPSTFDALPTDRPVWSINSRKLARFMMASGGFLGGFVIFEPSPYEGFLIVALVTFLVAGMRLGQHAQALGFLFVLFNLGGLLSAFTVASTELWPLYIAVSLFLGLTAVFWCAALQADVQRFRSLMRGYVLGAVVTASLGILGYFKAIPGTEIFTRYDRAMGAFQDPNVFAPFLVLPFLYLLHGIAYRSPRLLIVRAVALFIIAFGIFLAFSRAGWGLTLISATMLYALALATERNPRQRQKLIVAGMLGVGLGMVAILVALQFEAVSNMVAIRAKVVQDYDGAQVGRFARHAIGFEWALTRPLGMGPLQFGRALGEDPHNIWVKALMAYGWLGFVSFLTIVIITLIGGAKILGRKRPWQPYLQCAYCVFVGHLFVSWVIDVDHWRHVYLIIGMIWACMALEQRHGHAFSNHAQTLHTRPQSVRS